MEAVFPYMGIAFYFTPHEAKCYTERRRSGPAGHSGGAALFMLAAGCAARDRAARRTGSLLPRVRILLAENLRRVAQEAVDDARRRLAHLLAAEGGLVAVVTVVEVQVVGQVQRAGVGLDGLALLIGDAAAEVELLGVDGVEDGVIARGLSIRLGTDGAVVVESGVGVGQTARNLPVLLLIHADKAAGKRQGDRRAARGFD